MSSAKSTREAASRKSQKNVCEEGQGAAGYILTLHCKAPGEYHAFNLS